MWGLHGLSSSSYPGLLQNFALPSRDSSQHTLSATKPVHLILGRQKLPRSKASICQFLENSRQPTTCLFSSACTLLPLDLQCPRSPLHSILVNRSTLNCRLNFSACFISCLGQAGPRKQHACNGPSELGALTWFCLLSTGDELRQGVFLTVHASPHGVSSEPAQGALQARCLVLSWPPPHLTTGLVSLLELAFDLLISFCTSVP